MIFSKKANSDIFEVFGYLLCWNDELDYLLAGPSELHKWEFLRNPGFLRSRGSNIYQNRSFYRL